MSETKFIPEENEFQVTIAKKHFVESSFTDIFDCALARALKELGFVGFCVGSCDVSFDPSCGEIEIPDWIDYDIIQDYPSNGSSSIQEHYKMAKRGEGEDLTVTLRRG